MSHTNRQREVRRSARRMGLRGSAVLVGALSLGLAGGSSEPRTAHEELVGLGVSGGVSGTAGDRTSTAALALSVSTFRIAGSVAGLFPGFGMTLMLTVTNPQPFKIVVTSITTSVGNANVGCTAANVSIAAFSGKLLVPAQGSAHTSVPVSMAASAPDACIGATFPLSYRGLAQKAVT